MRDKAKKAAYDRARYLTLRPQWLQNSRERHKLKRAAIRQHILQHLSENPCVDCGEDDPIVLEFDHVRGKSFNICDAGWKLTTIAKLKAEIAKCEIRCANCHRRKTHLTAGRTKAHCRPSRSDESRISSKGY